MRTVLHIRVPPVAAEGGVAVVVLFSEALAHGPAYVSPSWPRLARRLWQ